MRSGTRLGPYEVLSLVGAGGMGEVYRAHDERIGRDVAIKVLPPEFAADRERLRRFEHEARAAGALDHPNILAVHDVGTFDGLPYMVTELLEGETLRGRMSAGLATHNAVEIGIQIARGLAAAHEKGIIHRDLKPANVFVTNDGHVKILDFGLARVVHPEVKPDPYGPTATSASSTEAGAVLGTMGYMSPEQLRGQPADARSDIFAFGCVLYEMLSGRPPFQKATGADTVSAVLLEEPPGLDSSGSKLPPGLRQIVRRCLEKRPQDRFQSARDLDFALQAEKESLTPSLLGSARLPRRWLWAGMAVLGAVAAAAFALYWLTVRGHPGAPPAAGLIRSIAVLPLANLSGDPGQEYFSDGMTEELIATLSKISALKVISRTSVMQFKGSKKPLREIAAALGVEGVIEGSVLRAGERVRITVQLINASSDTHLWAESYGRDLKDVLELQSEVARAVAGEVRAKLTPQEQMRLASNRPVNPEAYELYLKGGQVLNLFSEEEFKKGLDDIQRAIDLDPTWAPAHARLASAYMAGGIRGYQPLSEAIEKARPALRKALELDEGLAEAHVRLGDLLYNQWDWSGAEREFQRAIALDPNGSLCHKDYGAYLMTVGRSDEAVTECRRALELDPLLPIMSFMLGEALYYADRYDESIPQLRTALQVDPTGMGLEARLYLALNYRQKHMHNEAIAECDKALKSWPEDHNVLGICGNVYGVAGKRQHALALLGRLKGLSPKHYVDPVNVALVYDGLGDSERAMEWLERSYRERSACSCGIGVNHWTDKLRSDPRFEDLMRRMNYPASIGAK